MSIPSETSIDQVIADTGMGRMQAVNHLRARQLIALRLRSPNRAAAGRELQSQHDVSQCPLFSAADEPRLL